MPANQREGVLAGTISEIVEASASEAVAAEPHQPALDLPVPEVALGLSNLKAASGVTAARTGRRGRPAGSANKASVAAKAAIVDRLGEDPLHGLADFVQMDTKALAAEIGADALDVLKLQVAVRETLVGYVHGKPRHADAAGEGNNPVLVLMGGSSTATVQPAANLGTIEQLQVLTPSPETVVTGDQSQTSRQPIDNIDQSAPTHTIVNRKRGGA